MGRGEGGEEGGAGDAVTWDTGGASGGREGGREGVEVLGPCCPEFNSGGRTRSGFGVGVRPEVGLAQVRTFAKLLVTHGFRLKGPLFADSEYGLGSGSGYGLEGGGVGRER